MKEDDIYSKNCLTFDELEASIDNYMDYYNNYRYQWELKKLAPVQYRNQLLPPSLFQNVLDIGTILFSLLTFINTIK